jgi:hypothetical protein
MSMSGHQSAKMKSDIYLTPPEWIRLLGPFHMDPCTPHDMPWRTANVMLTKTHDGLKLPWEGRVWLNPPFGQVAARWLRKMALHGNGIALIPARTETAMFYESVWGKADAVCFVRGRPHFHANEDTTVHHNGKEIPVARGEPYPFNSGAPITLVAYGAMNGAALMRARLGIVVPISACSSTSDASK